MCLALVQMLPLQPRAGRLPEERYLIKVSEAQQRDNTDEWVVGIDCVMGMAHPIPSIDVPGLY